MHLLQIVVILGVLMREGELRVLILHHLGCSLLLGFFFLFCHTSFIFNHIILKDFTSILTVLCLFKLLENCSTGYFSKVSPCFELRLDLRLRY